MTKEKDNINLWIHELKMGMTKGVLKNILYYNFLILQFHNCGRIGSFNDSVNPCKYQTIELISKQ